MITVYYGLLRVVMGGYRWLRVVTDGYRWLRMVTSGYKWLRGLRGLWGITVGGEGGGIKIF